MTDISKPLEALIGAVTIGTVAVSVTYFNHVALMYSGAASHFRTAENYQQQGNRSEATYELRRAKTELMSWNNPETSTDRAYRFFGLLLSRAFKKLNARIDKLDLELVRSEPLPHCRGDI